MIKKIVLEVGKKEIVLTLEQAKSLHTQLADLFVEKEVTRYIDHYVPRWHSPWVSYNGATASTTLTTTDNDGILKLNVNGES